MQHITTKNRLLTIVIFLLFAQVVWTQKEDYNWFASYFFSTNVSDTVFGVNRFDFNKEPVRIYSDSVHRINMSGGNATISDSEGNLLAYSNGQVIVNSDNKFIEDTINYSFDLPSPICNEWDATTTVLGDTIITDGLLGGQRIIMLPIGRKYFAFYAAFNYCNYQTYKFMYAEFVIDEQNPKGKIIAKDIPFLYGDFCDMVHAVRHGNGRDWWVVFFSEGHKTIYTALLTENGIEEVNEMATGINDIVESIGQICFSPDGTKVAFYTGIEFSEQGGGLGIFDFDRCDGTVSNLKFQRLPSYDLCIGVAFSGNGRYLYTPSDNLLLQYDTENVDIFDSKKVIAEYDGFAYQFPDFPIEYDVNFYEYKLAPDGKIYIFPSSAMQRYLSVIDNPHEDHTKINVKQHSIFMPRAFQRTSPNLPNFRLGPMDGSACDTLGLDNNPVAKFRYDADTLDHRALKFTDLSYFRPESWTWDFGDGSPLVYDRYPEHVFEKNGSYDVCLTVSNENSSHTNCRKVTIGTTATDDIEGKPAIDISIYPNPVSDMLQVTLGEYIPQQGFAVITDLLGKKLLTQRIYYGQNVLNLSTLSSGLYYCTFTDGKRILEVKKIFKE